MDLTRVEFIATVVLGSAIFLFGAWLLFFYRDSYPEVQMPPARVLVVAPHPDDDFAIAGGRLIQNAKAKAASLVVYMTDGCPEMPARELCIRQRRAEAKRAMATIGIEESQLIFFGYTDKTGFNANTSQAAIHRLVGIIERFQPDEVYFPTYEGGHCIHDLTNYIVAKAVQISSHKPRMLEAPEYNHFVSFKTPWRLLYPIRNRIYRLFYPERPLPFAPRFLPESEQPLLTETEPFQLEMSKEELELKRRAINNFVTQNLAGSLTQKFSMADRYRDYPGYDYSQPPYNVEHGLLYLRCRITNFIRRLIPGIRPRDCLSYSFCRINFEKYLTYLPENGKG